MALVLLLNPESPRPAPRSAVIVVDGDCLTVLHGGEAEGIHLFGIDHMSKNMDSGKGAKGSAAVWYWAGFGVVEIEPVTVDRSSGKTTPVYSLMRYIKSSQAVEMFDYGHRFRLR
jgi:hypothetical protein